MHIMSSEYKNLKNYIHNDLGITKSDIQDIIEKTISEEIKKLLTDEDKLKSIIYNFIQKAIKEDQNKILYHILINFDSLLDEKITTTIFNEVKSKLKIELVDN